MANKRRSKKRSKKHSKRGDTATRGSSINKIHIHLGGVGGSGSQPFPVMMPFSNMQEQSRVNSIPTPYNSSVPDFLGHSSYPSSPFSSKDSPSSIPQSVSMPNAQSIHVPSDISMRHSIPVPESVNSVNGQGVSKRDVSVGESKAEAHLPRNPLVETETQTSRILHPRVPPPTQSSHAPIHPTPRTTPPHENATASSRVIPPERLSSQFVAETRASVAPNNPVQPVHPPASTQQSGIPHPVRPPSETAESSAPHMVLDRRTGQVVSRDSYESRQRRRRLKRSQRKSASGNTDFNKIPKHGSESGSGKSIIVSAPRSSKAGTFRVVESLSRAGTSKVVGSS